MVDRDAQTFDNVAPGFGLFEVKADAAARDFFLVFNVVRQAFAQIDNFRLKTAELIRDQGEHVGIEGVLELGVLVQLVEHDTGIGFFFQFDDDADSLIAVGLITDIGNAFDFFVLGELGDALDQPCFVDHVGQVAHDDALAVVLHRLDVCIGADNDAAAAGAVGITDA